MIYEFAPGQTEQFRAVAINCCLAAQISVSGRGDIGIGMQIEGSCCGGFLGVVEPTKRFIQHLVPHVQSASYVAYAANGVLWASGVEKRFFGPGRLGFVRNSNSNFVEIKVPAGDENRPIAVDPANNVLVSSGSNIDAFDEKGQHRYSVALSGLTQQPIGIAISQDGSLLFVVSSAVSVYAFPGGGSPLSTYPISGAGPIAIGEL